MGRDGAATAPRPRYPRIAAAGGSLLVTLVAVLGGFGLIPVSSSQAQPAPDQGAAPADRAMRLSDQVTGEVGTLTPTSRPTTPPATDKSSSPSAYPDVPARSGTGRRVVFDMAAQRVWLVGERHDRVLRTYLVSGSVTDNLHTGTYEVYSKSRHAVGVDDSGTMEYMVRFAHGSRAAIGFHDIPVLGGHLVQARDQLGTAHSHGCIRQWRPDARALWAFARVGTKVVVV
jgi:lipoprotein-anchoring transpeptidase ErfK/SrfK